MKRWPAIVLIVALLVAAMNYDRRPDTERARRAREANARLTDLPSNENLPEMMAQVAPDTAAASTWYCAGGTATGQDPFNAPTPREEAAARERAEGEGGGDGSEGAEGDGGSEGEAGGENGDATDGGEAAPPPPTLVAEHRVVIANPTDRPLKGVLTAFPDKGSPATEPIEVGPLARISVDLSDVVEAEFASATVELQGSGLVEHEIRGPLGIAFAPCADHASRTWFFAAGSTVRGASETLFFFNPFPDDAVVDVTFATEEGIRTPRAFQDLPIPAFSVRAVPVTDKVTVRQLVAATVNVRRGQVVTDRIQVWDGTPPPEEDEEGGEGGEGEADPPPTSSPGDGTGTGELPPEERTEGEVPPEERTEGEEEVLPPEPDNTLPAVTRTGMSISTGVRRPSGVWVFPDGRRMAGASEQIVIYNPTDRAADVDLEISPADPEQYGEIDPIGITIAPHAVQMFDVDTDERIPADVAHHVIVRSLNGVPVVAERVAAGKLFRSEGSTIVTGSPLAARRWHFASGAANDTLSTQLVMVNPGDEVATARVEVLDDGKSTVVPGAKAIEIPPGSRVVLEVNKALERDLLALVVSSDQPIVAERATYRVGRIGITSSIGIPVSDQAELLQPT